MKGLAASFECSGNPEDLHIEEKMRIHIHMLEMPQSGLEGAFTTDKESKSNSQVRKQLLSQKATHQSRGNLPVKKKTCESESNSPVKK